MAGEYIANKCHLNTYHLNEINDKKPYECALKFSGEFCKCDPLGFQSGGALVLLNVVNSLSGKYDIIFA